MKILNYSLLLVFISTGLLAQKAQNQFTEKHLENEKELIERQERLELKKRIKQVNTNFLNEEITSSEADSLKLKYAEESAKRIEERILQKENEYLNPDKGPKENKPIAKVKSKKNKREIPYYMDSDIVLAFGLNNLFDPYDHNNNEYEAGKSFFFEGGWSWKTNLIPYRNFFNIRYGLSLHVNWYSPEKGQIFFTDTDKDIVKLEPLEQYYSEETQVKLVYSNLVFPVHLEFGSRRYRQFKSFQKGNKTMTRFRPRGFIFGIGGYAGLNIFNEQRFKRPFESGEIVQEVNFNDFNYGISSYLSFPYLVTIYGKLDTSPLFTNQVEPLYNLSLGIRIGIN